MALPRFSRGRLGNLHHYHWNEVADVVEAADAFLRKRGIERPALVRQDNRWLARITEVDTNANPIRYGGQEVRRKNDAFDILPVAKGGRVMSTSGTGPTVYGINRWEPGGSSAITVGTIVEVYERHGDDGALRRDIFGGTGITGAYAAKITAVAAGPTYAAQATDAPTVTIPAGSAPINRPFPTNLVTYLPLALNAPCIILVGEFTPGVPGQKYLFAWEQIQTETCDGGAAQANDIDSDRGTAAARLFLHSTYI